MRRIFSLLIVLVLSVCFCFCAFGDGFTVETANLTDAQRLLRGYDPSTKSYMYMTFGNYPYYSDGSEAPCLWRILSADGDTAFVVNEYVVDFYQFHSIKKDQPEWKDYDICPQINSEMINKMFTADEQEALRFNEDLGKLFILDNTEYMTAAYGFRNIKTRPQFERKCEPTPYARSLPVSYINENGCTWYWSRTCRHTAAGGYENIIGYDGHISMAGFLRWGGVRPACYIELSMLDQASGSGTMSDPYSFNLVH